MSCSNRDKLGVFFWTIVRYTITGTKKRFFWGGQLVKQILMKMKKEEVFPADSHKEEIHKLTYSENPVEGILILKYYLEYSLIKLRYLSYGLEYKIQLQSGVNFNGCNRRNKHNKKKIKS